MAVRCATCDEMFETPELLAVHTDEAHGADDGRRESEAVTNTWKTDVPPEDPEGVGDRFTCPECGAELSSRDSLDMHVHDAHGGEIARAG